MTTSPNEVSVCKTIRLFPVRYAVCSQPTTLQNRYTYHPFHIGNPSTPHGFKKLLARNVYHSESCKEQEISFEYSSEYVKKAFGYKPIVTTNWKKFLNIADID